MLQQYSAYNHGSGIWWSHQTWEWVTFDLLGFSHNSLESLYRMVWKTKNSEWETVLSDRFGSCQEQCSHLNNHSLQLRRKAFHQAQNVELWVQWTAEDHIEFHSCQLQTGIWGHYGHRLNNTYCTFGLFQCSTVQLGWACTSDTTKDFFFLPCCPNMLSILYTSTSLCVCVVILFSFLCISLSSS